MTAKRSPSNSPPFEPPKYVITVGRDNSLQWDPPPKSKELGFALSYYFPQEATMVGKMQAALRKWSRHQSKEQVRQTTEQKDIIKDPDSSSASSDPDRLANATHVNLEAQTMPAALGRSSESLPPPKRSKIPGLFTWRVGADDGAVVKPTKRTYLKEERSRGRRNRGEACDYHRRRKQKLSNFYVAMKDDFILISA